MAGVLTLEIGPRLVSACLSLLMPPERLRIVIANGPVRSQPSIIVEVLTLSSEAPVVVFFLKKITNLGQCTMVVTVLLPIHSLGLSLSTSVFDRPPTTDQDQAA